MCGLLMTQRNIEHNGLPTRKYIKGLQAKNLILWLIKKLFSFIRQMLSFTVLPLLNQFMIQAWELLLSFLSATFVVHWKCETY